MSLLQPVTNFFRRIETSRLPIGQNRPVLISPRCRECGTPLVPRRANDGRSMWKCPSSWSCKAIVYFDWPPPKVIVGDVLDNDDY